MMRAIRPWARRAGVVMAGLVAGACGVPGSPPAGLGPASRAPAVVVPAGTRAPDLLRAGDVVRVRIWREPELSGEFTVDETGVVVFPKIGARQVVRQSPAQLKHALLAAYDWYLLNPSVDIVFLRRINVLGAVAKPGLYPVDPTMTVADALALAGGTTSAAKQDRVELVRGGDRLVTPLSQRTLIGDSPIRSGDQLYVPERSWVMQNAGFVSIGVSATLGILGLLVRR